MRVIMFQERFADLVARGIKAQTVRGIRKRPPRIGEEFSFRVWQGKPYRSPQTEFARGYITACGEVTIGGEYLYLPSGDAVYERVLLDDFACSDGFANWEELFDWFTVTHGTPFEGMLIQWQLTWSHRWEAE